MRNYNVSVGVRKEEETWEQLRIEIWRNGAGEIDRAHGPAMTAYDLDSPDLKRIEKHYRNGKLHRDGDEPAFVERDWNGHIIKREWYRDGLLHREGGPARIQESPTDDFAYIEEWRVEGDLHRVGKPASITRDENGNTTHEHWSINGRTHRTDGPALFYTDDGSDPQFWIDGQQVESLPDAAQDGVTKPSP